MQNAECRMKVVNSAFCILHSTFRLLVLVLLLSSSARAQGAPASADEDAAPFGIEITPKAAQSIERGLEWLAKEQHRDGYWIETVGRKVNEEYQGRPGK